MNSIYVRFATGICSSTLFLFLSACGTAPSDSNIRVEYAKAAYRLGLTPVYPPREDFQVGDIRLVSYGFDSKNEKVDYLDSVNIWVDTHVPLIKASEDHLNTRVVFSETAAIPGDNNAEAQDDLIHGQFRYRKDLSVDSLLIEAFPAVTADAGLSTSTAISRVFGSLGLSTARRTQVTLDFNDVRSYGLPLKLGLQDGKNKVQSRDFQITSLDALSVGIQRSKNIGQELSEERCLSASIITRVLVTRSITYTYSNAQIRAAALRRADVADVEAPSPVVITVNNAQSGDPASPTNEQINQIVTQANSASSTAQGIGLSFVSWDALGLKLERRFQRPVAIAWEGIGFKPRIRAFDEPTNGETAEQRELREGQIASFKTKLKGIIQCPD